MALGNLVTSYTAMWQGLSITHFGYPTTLGLDAAAGLICIALLPWLGSVNRQRVRAGASPIAAVIE